MPRPTQPRALDDWLHDMQTEANEIADSLSGKSNLQKMWVIHRAWWDIHERSHLWNMGESARQMMLAAWSNTFFQRLHENSDAKGSE